MKFEVRPFHFICFVWYLFSPRFMFLFYLNVFFTDGKYQFIISLSVFLFYFDSSECGGFLYFALSTCDACLACLSSQSGFAF